MLVWKDACKCTDENRILHTLLVKHYNDLLERQSSERGKDEVSYFYVGDVFRIHLGTKYADFQEKIFVEISVKMFQTLHKKWLSPQCAGGTAGSVCALNDTKKDHIIYCK